LENEEAHISAMVNVIFLEKGRGVVLYPHTGKLVVVNVIALEATLQWMDTHTELITAKRLQLQI